MTHETIPTKWTSSIVKCQNCGIEIKVNSARIKQNRGWGFFCSIRCKKIWQTSDNNPLKGIEDKICINCGKKFQITGNHKTGTFCSKPCRSEYNKKQNTTKVCKYCGNQFSIIKAREETALFCSRKCKGKYSSHTGRVFRACKQCGKEFTVVKKEIEKGYGKFCSEPCCRAHNIRERHHQWKGGISYFPYCEKFNRSFKNRVRAFFNYKCVICGMTQEENGEALSVHHIYYNKMMCCDGSQRLVVALCKAHHGETTAGDREYWSQYLHETLALQYGNKCYYTREEYAAITSPTQSPSPLLSTPALQRSTEQSLS